MCSAYFLQNVFRPVFLRDTVIGHFCQNEFTTKGSVITFMCVI